MPPKTTKEALLKQVADLKDAVTNMKEPRTLKAAGELTVHHIDLHRGSVDMHHVDHMREHLRRDVARHMAEELIRSGAIKFSETLEDDYRRFAKVLRVSGSLQVC
ncbi:hypothetical protein [Rhodanobacter sp. MP7CTX1]|uniref:hypothetical protein n=1 Tax=Rhodanobacter sp. MP7CTX1 TaxID=2723084 RepID=UPI0016124E42|nr:hypothetical protein [Rhodanobacter sp. MP7CTX1]MBB6185785.1 hypothetical protein [Rhodanobacter sp. MP7CTX1]